MADVTPTRDSSTSFGFAQDKLLRSLGMTGLNSNPKSYLRVPQELCVRLYTQTVCSQSRWRHIRALFSTDLDVGWSGGGSMRSADSIIIAEDVSCDKGEAARSAKESQG
jgi:hypothetical protein